MLRGAARYLETGHAQFIQTSLQANRSQVTLPYFPVHSCDLTGLDGLNDETCITVLVSSPSSSLSSNKLILEMRPITSVSAKALTTAHVLVELI